MSRGDKAVRAQSVRRRMAMLGLYVRQSATWFAGWINPSLRLTDGKENLHTSAKVAELSLPQKLAEVPRELGFVRQKFGYLRRKFGSLGRLFRHSGNPACYRFGRIGVGAAHERAWKVVGEAAVSRIMLFAPVKG